jgi:hypothetical protein
MEKQIVLVEYKKLLNADEAQSVTLKLKDSLFITQTIFTDDCHLTTTCFIFKLNI